MTKSLATLTLVFLTGCSSMTMYYPTEGKPLNCADWVMARRREGDTIWYGHYMPSPPLENHLWFERDGVCYDNMNPLGFDCKNELYLAWAKLDLSDPVLLQLLLDSRG